MIHCCVDVMHEIHGDSTDRYTLLYDQAGWQPWRERWETPCRLSTHPFSARLPSSLVCADMDASQTLWQPIRNSWLFGLTWPHTPQRRLFYKPFVFVGPRRCTVCRPVKLIYFINEYQSIIGFSFFGQHACSCSNDRFYHSHFAEHLFTGWIRLFYLKFWQSSDSGADLPFRCVRH